MTSVTEIINAQLDGWADLGIVRFPPAVPSPEGGETK